MSERVKRIHLNDTFASTLGSSADISFLCIIKQTHCRCIKAMATIKLWLSFQVDITIFTSLVTNRLRYTIWGQFWGIGFCSMTLWELRWILMSYMHPTLHQAEMTLMFEDLLTFGLSTRTVVFYWALTGIWNVTNRVRIGIFSSIMQQTNSRILISFFVWTL